MQPAQMASQADEDDEQAEIEALRAEIQREELEILALKELKAEREKEVLCSSASSDSETANDTMPTVPNARAGSTSAKS